MNFDSSAGNLAGPGSVAHQLFGDLYDERLYCQHGAGGGDVLQAAEIDLPEYLRIHDARR